MRTKSIGLVVVMTLAAIVPLTMADHSVYSDEFADGTQDWGSKGTAQWKVISGQLGGVLWGKNNVNNSTDSTAWTGRTTWEDYRYKVEVMRIGNNTTQPWVGVTWRGDYFKGYYLLALRDGEYFFGKPDLAGGHTTLQTWTPLSWIDADAWNEVKIVTDGDQHSFYLNGDHIQTITDNTTAKGRIGVALGPDAQAVYDNAHMVTLAERLDTLDPVATIDSPTATAPLGAALVVGHNVVVQVTANDTYEGGNESGLDRIRVYLDGELAGTQANNGGTSYTFNVNVKRAGLGTHTITVMAEDRAHHRAFDSIEVFVTTQCVQFGPMNPVCAP